MQRRCPEVRQGSFATTFARLGCFMRLLTGVWLKELQRSTKWLPYAICCISSLFRVGFWTGAAPRLYESHEKFTRKQCNSSRLTSRRACVELGPDFWWDLFASSIGDLFSLLHLFPNPAKADPPVWVYSASDRHTRISSPERAKDLGAIYRFPGYSNDSTDQTVLWWCVLWYLSVGDWHNCSCPPTHPPAIILILASDGCGYLAYTCDWSLYL